MRQTPYKIYAFNGKKPSDKLMPLWTQTGNWSEERLDWFCQDNSYGEPISWGLKYDGSDNIIGFASIFKRIFSIEGVNILGGVNCDFLVHPDHRTLGPAMLMLRTLITDYKREGLKFLLAYPNNNARLIFRRCGYRKIGSLTRWVKILKTYPYFKRKFSNSTYWKPVSVTLDWLFTLFSYDIWVVILNKNRVIIQEYHKGDMSRLSSSVSLQASIIGDRNDDYLMWRYEGPHREAYMLKTLKIDNNSIGYIAYRIKNEIFFLDDMYVNNVNKYFKSAMAAIIKYSRTQKLNAVNFGFQAHPEIERSLKAFRFSPREDRDVLIHTDDEALLKTFIDNKKWYLTEGDVDL